MEKESVFLKVFMTVPENPNVFLSIIPYQDNLMENRKKYCFADIREISTFFGQYPECFKENAIYLDLNTQFENQKFCAIEFNKILRRNYFLSKSDLKKFPIKYAVLKKI